MIKTNIKHSYSAEIEDHSLFSKVMIEAFEKGLIGIQGYNGITKFFKRKQRKQSNPFLHITPSEIVSLYVIEPSGCCYVSLNRFLKIIRNVQIYIDEPNLKKECYKLNLIK